MIHARVHSVGLWELDDWVVGSSSLSHLLSVSRVSVWHRYSWVLRICQCQRLITKLVNSKLLPITISNITYQHVECESILIIIIYMQSLTLNLTLAQWLWVSDSPVTGLSSESVTYCQSKLSDSQSGSPWTDHWFAHSLIQWMAKGESVIQRWVNVIVTLSDSLIVILSDCVMCLWLWVTVTVGAASHESTSSQLSWYYLLQSRHNNTRATATQTA